MLAVPLQRALIVGLASFCLISCKLPKRGSLVLQDQSSNSARSFDGIGRWTPYSSEQNGQGSCGSFSQYDSDPKKWAAVSEKFAKEQLNFKGCENRGSGESPNCWQIMSNDGESLCGTKLTVSCDEGRSKSGLCANTDSYSVVLVDICPSDRSYHDWADPDSAGDTACAESYVVDLDESIRVGSGGMLTREDNPALKIVVGDGVASSPVDASADASAEAEAASSDFVLEESPLESSGGSQGYGEDYSSAPPSSSGSWDPVPVSAPSPSPAPSGGSGGYAAQCGWAQYCWGIYSLRWWKNGSTSMGYKCQCGLWIKEQANKEKGARNNERLLNLSHLLIQMELPLQP